jgi:hypothetical protein
LFTLEFVLKMVALGPWLYLSDGWNVFDALVVFVSLLELGLTTAATHGGGVDGLK